MDVFLKKTISWDTKQIFTNSKKKIEGTPCSLSDHNAIKIKIRSKQISSKYTNLWRLNNSLLNDEWIQKENKKDIKNYLEVNEKRNTAQQNLCNTLKVILQNS